MSQSHLTNALFTPSQADVDGVMEWFKKCDSLVASHDVGALVTQAHFPITVITDDSQGECVTQHWDEDAFRASLENNESNPSTTIENSRQPIFLNQNLAVVVTESTVTTGDNVQRMRYADVLVKKNGEWKFKSMIQAGWGDMLKMYFGA